MSTKRDNFVRLAEARVKRALREIRLIGNLSNRSAYSYTDSDLRAIFKALQKETEGARARFSGEVAAGDKDFKLLNGN